MRENVENTSPSAEREIYASRLFDAPRPLVYSMWTDPKHIANWWGPIGFTTTIQKMDVRVGGAWLLVMHGPDGIDYKNESTFTDIVVNERFCYSHDNWPKFQATVLFSSEGEKTRVKMRMVFESVEVRAKVAEQHGAVEGQQQTLDRLEEELRSL